MIDRASIPFASESDSEAIKILYDFAHETMSTSQLVEWWQEESTSAGGELVLYNSLLKTITKLENKPDNLFEEGSPKEAETKNDIQNHRKSIYAIFAPLDKADLPDLAEFNPDIAMARENYMKSVISTAKEVVTYFNHAQSSSNQLRDELNSLIKASKNSFKQFSEIADNAKFKELLNNTLNELSSKIKKSGREPYVYDELSLMVKRYYTCSNFNFNESHIHLLQPLKEAVVSHFRLHDLAAYLSTPYIKASLEGTSQTSAFVNRNEAAIKEAFNARQDWVLEIENANHEEIKRIIGRAQALRADLKDLQVNASIIKSYLKKPVERQQWKSILQDIKKLDRDKSKRIDHLHVSLLTLSVKERLSRLTLPDEPWIKNWPSKYTTYFK
ncbi:hypothetical protein [uncultured Endozoicomonas sp.]|uniref:hypothetical protein n=1 Tax=uncultured Endozoicomonas sp. TaxID=432652 RepID=UPI002629A95B|nr:hypothetical protein [uncultured Endozoicomonas sp.]